MDTSQDINTVEWFFGYGGNHLGLKRVLPNLRLLAACEIEEFAVENILAKMEAGLLEAAPIWSDCKTFPWEPFVDRTHLFVASYPCQPFSAAGKRQGTEDERHLWPYVYRWILRARPLLVFLENVEGHVSLGLSTVISDLEEGGYKAAWGIFSASEVGAPHQRKRVFILAYDQRQRIEELGRQIAVGSQQHSAWDDGGMEHAAANGREYGSSLSSRNGEGNSAAELWPQLGAGCSQAWPSRPGEQQFAWEPPRVVADAKSQRANRRLDVCDKECGSGSALPWDVEQSGEGNLVDAAGARQQAQRDESNGQRREDAAGESSELGNAEKCDGVNAPRIRRALERQSRRRVDSDPSVEGGAMGHPNSPRPQERPRQQRAGLQGADSDGGEAADREAFASLGRDLDGALPWARLSELSGLSHQELAEICHWMVASDNRTDELRLLGNGVVPATAERAFRVLVGELMEHQP